MAKLSHNRFNRVAGILRDTYACAIAFHSPQSAVLERTKALYESAEPAMSRKLKASIFGTVPNTSVSLLSAPSKMPGYSWSLPAYQSCPRAHGTICDTCYAGKGFYRMPSVVNAQSARFTWTRESMRSASGRIAWVNTLYRAIYQTRELGEVYFRVHDSGDMFSPSYAACWVELCVRLPKVKFWIPTRAWQQPRRDNLLHVMSESDGVMAQLVTMASLPNVTVRPSALNFGDVAPKVAGLHAGTTADSQTARQCPAHLQDNQCGKCRICWNGKGTEVSYTRH